MLYILLRKYSIQYQFLQYVNQLCICNTTTNTFAVLLLFHGENNLVKIVITNLLVALNNCNIEMQIKTYGLFKYFLEFWLLIQMTKSFLKLFGHFSLI